MNMLKTFILVFFSTLFISASAQTPISEAVRRADITPAWPGCDPKMPDCTKSRLLEFINANLQMPIEAKKESQGGLVAMEFVVEKNGLVGEVKAMHDPGYGLVAEATRVINLLNEKKIKFMPAEVDGKRVAYRFAIPVSFNLMAPPREKMEIKAAPLPADGVYEVVDVMPKFAGCETASEDSVDCTFRKMISHIKSNLNYPKVALDAKVGGQVLVQFVVDSTGAITKPSILKGIGSGCDEEAMRVITTMPKWIPGKQDGKAVAVRMKVPMTFQLPKSE